MENIDLIEYQITDLDFHFPRDGWPKSLGIETEFGVRVNEQEKGKVLLEIKQEINYEKSADNESGAIFRVCIIGLLQIYSHIPTGEGTADIYHDGFKLLYKKLRKKITSFEKVTRIQFPPMPKWKELNSKH